VDRYSSLLLYWEEKNVMQTLRKRSSLLVLGLLLLIVSACGSGGNSAADLLNRSVEAMQKLKTSHFALDTSISTNLGGLLASSYDDTSASDSDLTLTAKANGQIQYPNQSAFDFQFHMPTAGQNQDRQFSAVVKDSQAYFKGKDGKWYVTDLSSGGMINEILASSQVANYNKLLELGNKATLTDHGVEDRNGEKLRHITLTFDKTTLNEVFGSLGLTGNQNSRQQLLSQFVDRLNVKTLTLDTWIDEATAYLHHLDFKLDVSLDTKSLGSLVPSNMSLPPTVTLKIDLGVDLTKFDEPVKIEIPQNATPANDISQIFAN
jgi:hypothetical protein